MDLARCFPAAQRAERDSGSVSRQLGNCHVQIGVVLIVYLRDSEIGLNWGGLLDGFCFAALGVGLYFRSRTAAVLSFGLYVAEFFYNSVMVRPQNPIVPAMIALALFAGIRGSFAYQKLPPKPKDLPTIEQSFRSVKPAPENPNQPEQSS